MPAGWIVVQEDWCKACGLCRDVCKPAILRFANHFNSRGFHPIELGDPRRCTACAACAIVCPDSAIEVFRSRLPSH